MLIYTQEVLLSNNDQLNVNLYITWALIIIRIITQCAYSEIVTPIIQRFIYWDIRFLHGVITYFRKDELMCNSTLNSHKKVKE